MGKKTYNPNDDRGATFPEWLLRLPELSFGAKVAYARLAQYREEEGVIEPSVETLANEIGAEVRSATRYLQELRESGLVTVVSGSKKGLPNRYQLTERTMSR